MALTVERVIDVISKPSNQRLESEIEAVVPWLKRRSQLLKGLEKPVLYDILKNCDHQRCHKDDVIIRQGDVGEIFYIILHGSVSVYIDSQLSGEDNIATVGGTPNTDKQSRKKRTAPKQPDPVKKINGAVRTKFGKFIVKFEPGKSFGEIALLTKGSIRNASIIVDEDTDFLLVHRHLFNRCLKVHEEREFAAIRDFVDSHPFFFHWQRRLKRFMEMSVRKEIYEYNSVIVKQGDPVTALYFIYDGQAKLIVDPSKHKQQYRNLWPFEAVTDLYAQEFEWLRESRRQAIAKKYSQDPTVLQTRNDNLSVRRSEGYAAAEKLAHGRTVTLCSVSNMEVIGAAEVTSKLETYMHSVVCTSTTQVYILDMKNYERLIIRKNPATIDVIKNVVSDKLLSRMSTVQGGQVPLLKYLHFKLHEEGYQSSKELPPLRTTKSLPDPDLLQKYLVKSFIEGKTQICEPHVAGMMYYRELMQDKARIRENIRINQGIRRVREKLFSEKLKNRKPRSSAALKDALELLEDEDMIAWREHVGKDFLEMVVPPTKTAANNKHTTAKPKGVLKNKSSERKIENVSFKFNSLPKIQPHEQVEDKANKSDTQERLPPTEELTENTIEMQVELSPSLTTSPQTNLLNLPDSENKNAQTHLPPDMLSPETEISISTNTIAREEDALFDPLENVKYFDDKNEGSSQNDADFDVQKGESGNLGTPVAPTETEQEDDMDLETANSVQKPTEDSLHLDLNDSTVTVSQSEIVHEAEQSLVDESMPDTANIVIQNVGDGDGILEKTETRVTDSPKDEAADPKVYTEPVSSANVKSVVTLNKTQSKAAMATHLTAIREESQVQADTASSVKQMFHKGDIDKTSQTQHRGNKSTHANAPRYPEKKDANKIKLSAANSNNTQTNDKSNRIKVRKISDPSGKSKTRKTPNHDTVAKDVSPVVHIVVHEDEPEENSVQSIFSSPYESFGNKRGTDGEASIEDGLSPKNVPEINVQTVDPVEVKGDSSTVEAGFEMENSSQADKVTAPEIESQWRRKRSEQEEADAEETPMGIKAWNLTRQFVQKKIEKKKQESSLFDDRYTEYKDYDTSERTLNFLENRIRAFHLKYNTGKRPLKLPKLRRFKVEQDEIYRRMRQGGRVKIKRRMCDLAQSEYKIKDHQHVHYHMVPRLYPAQDLKKTRMVMQFLVDSNVRKTTDTDVFIVQQNSEGV